MHEGAAKTRPPRSPTASGESGCALNAPNVSGRVSVAFCRDGSGPPSIFLGRHVSGISYLITLIGKGFVRMNLMDDLRLRAVVRSEESSAAHGAMGQTGEDFSKKASMSAIPVSCFSWQGNTWRWRCCAICAAMECLFVFCVPGSPLGGA